MTAVAAIGGGHGLARTLAAARLLTEDVAAVVAVADDGGSTGRLRSAVDLPAVGDLRKAIVALASPESPLALAMHHRFGGGDVMGHAFGNLLIAAMAETGGDLVQALDDILRLTDGVGRVLPSAVEPVVLRARTFDGREIVGQVRIMRTKGIEEVSLVPAEPATCLEAIAAIERADLVLLGPGSLFTSVLAATAVPGVHDALARRRGALVYLCNLRPQKGESEGFDVGDHLAALDRHGIRPDVVLHDPATISGAPPVGSVVAACLAAGDATAHDPELLAAALRPLA